MFPSKGKNHKNIGNEAENATQAQMQMLYNENYFKQSGNSL
jgi:hypothetical protein